MKKLYFDKGGRRYNERELLVELIGRNREAALQILGMETRAPRPELPESKLDIQVEEERDGREVVRVRLGH